MKLKRADIERMMILCAAVLVVVLALRGGSQTTSQVLVDQTELPVQQTLAADPQNTIATVVYYQDGDNYLVPVTRQIPKTDGIAKAALNLMVKSPENDLQAARLGLRTVVPEGTSFEIDIRDGRANVNMSKEALTCASAADEAAMVDAVTNTMMCFSTVDEVTLEFDGQKRSKLTFGTDVSGVFSGGNLNLETTAAFSEDSNLVSLYFPSQTGRLLVPVTRTVFSDADPTTAMVELAKGPAADSGLERALPEKCGIRNVTLKNGVVSVDLTKEFATAMESSDGGRQAIRAILFTCSQFPGVEKVEVLIEGQKPELQPDTEATFINNEQEVIAQYPGVIELD